jgi:hypothetical protein
MRIPLHKMSIQNINEYLNEVCGIIASKQSPKNRIYTAGDKKKYDRQ